MFVVIGDAKKAGGAIGEQVEDFRRAGAFDGGEQVTIESGQFEIEIGGVVLSGCFAKNFPWEFFDWTVRFDV